MADTAGAAPLGTEPVSTGDQSTPLNQNQTPSPEGAPTTVDLTDDTPIRWQGEKEPIRYGDLAKRLQADFTRKNQSFSRQQAEWARQQAEERRQMQAEQARLQTIAAELLQRQRQGASPEDALLAELSGKPYVDGQTLAQVVKEIQTNGLGGLQRALQERDQVSGLLYQEVMNLRKELASLKSTHVTNQFDSKIRGWLKEGGYPDGLEDWAKEVYLAYEGEDLDQEFPAILERRWNQLQQTLRTIQQDKVAAAKKRPFAFPKPGGNGVPSGTGGLKGHESPRETADFLWDMMQASGGDET